MEPDARVELEDSLAQLIPRQPFPQYIDDAVFLDVKELLSQHPDKKLRSWSENPRLYTLLRMLDYDDDTPVFQKFDSEQISDFWLPLGSNTLDQFASSVDITPATFRRTQLHVLSKSELMSEEKLFSPIHNHRHIQHGSSHFEELDKIGKGGSAEVTRVQHKLSGQQFACKRILRADLVKVQRNQLIEFEQEVGVLQRISHPHLVSFVASFTDLTSFSLILNPVAKDVLKSMLERQSREQPLPEPDVSTLRHAFGCLATALAYLHEQKVRHKDIKPGNILLSEGRIYLCDFGIARDWSKSQHSTTEGEVMKFTRRYCAPEVFGRDPRNTKSDVFSLGCVFLELLSVVKGYPLEEVDSFLLEHSADASAQGLWCAPDAVSAWLVKLRSEKNDSADDIPLDWITTMIRTEPKDRLRAAELVELIHKNSADLPHPDLFLASCCARADSTAPVDAMDSPALHEPVSGSCNVRPSSDSLPHPDLLDLPRRRSSHSSVDKRSQPSSSGRRGSRGRSTSPSPSPDPGYSTDTIPSASDPTDGHLDEISTGSIQPRLRHITSRPERSSSVFSPPLPESEATSTRGPPRSPVLPPAKIDVKCACASRPNEKHIYNAPYAPASSHGVLQETYEFNADVPTIDTCAKCEIAENKVQVYESVVESSSDAPMPMVWWTTRRLVVSYLSGSPEMRHCSSYWLPLADIQFTLSETTVTLRWSDCNQVTERSSGNYGTHYDWTYQPKTPNNRVALRFNDVVDAQQFIDVVRLPYEDGTTVSRGRRVDVSESSEVSIFDIGRPGIRNYRVASLTTSYEAMWTSKLFVQWPEVDLDICIHEADSGYEMLVAVRNVATPTYHSDIRDEPAADYEKLAKFSQALQLKTDMMVTFPISMKHKFPAPPPDVADMLRYLTGWTLRYFAIVTKIKSKNKRFGSKKYGRADVMLWERHVDDSAVASQPHNSRVTFRLHEEMDLLWVSGAITDLTDVQYTKGFDATITVANKSRGRLINVGKMTAIESEDSEAPAQGHSRAASDAHGDYSDLVLTFENSRYRLEFVKLIEGFKAAMPLTCMDTSVDSVRRVDSLASNNDPPMR